MSFGAGLLIGYGVGCAFVLAMLWLSEGGRFPWQKDRW